MKKHFPQIGERFTLKECSDNPIGGWLVGEKVEVIGTLDESLLCVLLKPVDGLTQQLAQNLNLPKGQIIVSTSNFCEF